VQKLQTGHLAKDGKRKRPIISNHTKRMEEAEEFDDFDEDEDEDEAQRAKERKRRNKNSANQREAANTLKNTIGWLE
jgi:hypothetical protein